jgi:hypothetical protein
LSRHGGKPPSELAAVLVLAGVLALFAAGYWLFPHLQQVIWREECIASGRITGC